MIAEAKEINGLINKMWRFIKEHDIPDDSDQRAWDQLNDEITELCRPYWADSPMSKLFRAWMVDYTVYMTRINIERLEGKRTN